MGPDPISPSSVGARRSVSPTQARSTSSFPSLPQATRFLVWHNDLSLPALPAACSRGQVVPRPTRPCHARPSRSRRRACRCAFSMSPNCKGLYLLRLHPVEAQLSPSYAIAEDDDALVRETVEMLLQTPSAARKPRGPAGSASAGATARTRRRSGSGSGPLDRWMATRLVRLFPVGVALSESVTERAPQEDHRRLGEDQRPSSGPRIRVTKRSPYLSLATSVRT